MKAPPPTQHTTTNFTIQDFLIWLRGHQFSFLAEFLLAWTLIVAFSIFYILDYAKLRVELFLQKRRDGNNSFYYKTIPITPLPQTRKRFSISKETRLEQLIDILKDNATINPTNKDDDDDVPQETKSMQTKKWNDDDHIVTTIRNNCEARRIASLIMFSETSATTTTSSSSEAHQLLFNQLERLWPKFLKFPVSNGTYMEAKPQYSISLILPAYKEKVEDIQYTMTTAYQNCDDPRSVQVIVVDAGGSEDIAKALLDGNKHHNSTKPSWGDLQVVSYTSGGGRGGTLNYGASKAQGEIYTFLHSDTILPNHWDTMVKSELLQTVATTTTTNTTTTATTTDQTQVSVCAFSMGIDLSPRGLHGGRCPPGILGADRVLGYLRCKLCSLPYGDSALSFPSHIFEYLGGFPDQPLMEDYEIITLLRKRALLLENEKISILPARIQCSPRRWQTYGVCYTILINALCIRRYKAGATTEDLFELYYKQPTKKTS